MQRTETISPEKVKLLNTVKLMLTLNISLYSIDDFKGDDQFYKSSKKLRNKIETAEKAVEYKVAELMEAMFIADEQTTQSKLKQYEEIAKIIAKADFDDLTAIHEGLVGYFDKKYDTASEANQGQGA